jgi:hypothetical protein
VRRGVERLCDSVRTVDVDDVELQYSTAEVDRPEEVDAADAENPPPSFGRACPRGR